MGYAGGFVPSKKKAFELQLLAIALRQTAVISGTLVFLLVV